MSNALFKLNYMFFVYIQFEYWSGFAKKYVCVGCMAKAIFYHNGVVICKYTFLIKCTFSISILFDYYLLHCASSLYGSACLRVCLLVLLLLQIYIMVRSESSCDSMEIAKSLIYIYLTRVLKEN